MVRLMMMVMMMLAMVHLPHAPLNASIRPVLMPSGGVHRNSHGGNTAPAQSVVPSNRIKRPLEQTPSSQIPRSETVVPAHVELAVIVAPTSSPISPWLNCYSLNANTCC